MKSSAILRFISVTRSTYWRNRSVMVDRGISQILTLFFLIRVMRTASGPS